MYVLLAVDQTHAHNPLRGSDVYAIIISLQTLPVTACRSCIDGLWKIIRHEGPSVLWHGVNVSMLISVPMICMYLPMYDFILGELDSGSNCAPLVAGSGARAMSVVATSPLELLKTRIQAAGANAHSRSYAAGATSPFTAAVQQMRADMKVCSNGATRLVCQYLMYGTNSKVL